MCARLNVRANYAVPATHNGEFLTDPTAYCEATDDKKCTHTVISLGAICAGHTDQRLPEKSENKTATKSRMLHFEECQSEKQHITSLWQLAYSYAQKEMRILYSNDIRSQMHFT